MVTEILKGRDSTVAGFRGLSTDDKPTDVGNGAEFREIDTGDVYYFNEAGSAWVKWTGGSGGGGGGGSSDFSTAEVTVTNSSEEMTYYPQLPIISNNAITIGAIELGAGATETFTVALYKGSCIFYDGWIDPVALSGNATYDDETQLTTITGDCSYSVGGR